MPSLSQVSPLKWKQFALTTSVLTYEVLDLLKSGEAVEIESIKSLLRPKLNEIIEAEWAEMVGNSSVRLTEAGMKHLRSV